MGRKVNRGLLWALAVSLALAASGVAAPALEALALYVVERTR